MAYRPGVRDFPLAETASDRIRGPRGKTLDDLTPEAVARGAATIEDLRITPEALRAQASIARDAGRHALAENFERAAELVAVPQDIVMATYDMLRPGRASSRQALLDQAAMLRSVYGADGIAAFLENAAGHYHRRGLLRD
jgi:propanediol dehydratase small subunit